MKPSIWKVWLCSFLVSFGCDQNVVLLSPSTSVSDKPTGPTKVQTSSSNSVGHKESKPEVTAATLLAQRQAIDKEQWADEELARQHESVLVSLWDRLILEQSKSSGDASTILKGLGFESLRLGKQQDSGVYAHQIHWRQFGPGGQQLDKKGWSQWVDGVKSQGYRLVQSEWHHEGFERGQSGLHTSIVRLALHLENERLKERMIVRGAVQVQWSKTRAVNGHPVPRAVAVKQIDVLFRRGALPFQEIMAVRSDAKQGEISVQSVIAQDLNHDGLSELVFVQANRLYWNLGDGRFKRDVLVSHPRRFFEPAVIADLTGDGILDLVAADKQTQGYLLYSGDGEGRFTNPPNDGGIVNGPLTMPQVFSVGDIDGDGDLDVWVAQYRSPYVMGQMPTPFYDANDGWPAFMMRNDGNSQFTDVTQAAGLAEKRRRRTYSSSLIDLDGDVDLDLVVVNDFSGIDIYTNDGKGHFTDVTTQWVKEWHNFGMGLTFGDYDLDGELDFYVTGMASTTARRLDSMGLSRTDQPEVSKMRTVMGYGNRMYLRRDRGYVEPVFRDQTARTGWAWGTVTLDFDNDGAPDIYVGNGHSSGKSTKDYCTYFWTHDIYEEGSSPNLARDEMFSKVLEGYVSYSESWDGYQKNVLLMNQEGKGFVNIAFLMGVAAEYDSRGVLTDDIDGDGRMDLIVVQVRRGEQTAHVYRNEMKDSGHWIGFQLSAQLAKTSPIGARVTIQAGGRTHIKHIVTGDSMFAQHAPVAHFGLGKISRVDSASIRWPDGTVHNISSPKVGQYHRVVARRR